MEKRTERNGSTRIGVMVAACALIAGPMCVSSADAAPIYEDSFDRVGMLDGSAPDIGPAGVTWTANEDVLTDGSTANATDIRTMYLPFTPAAGHVYELSVDVHLDPAGGSNWYGLAFMGASPGTESSIASFGGFPDTDPRPGMILRHNGEQVLSRQASGDGELADTRLQTHNVPTPYTGIVTMKLVLDTTAPEWAVTWAVNDDIWRTDTYVTNPENIASVGVSASAAAEDLVYRFDNFTLIPEPASLALVGLGGLLLIRRRR